jgi:hypothetical protein
LPKKIFASSAEGLLNILIGVINVPFIGVSGRKDLRPSWVFQLAQHIRMKQSVRVVNQIWIVEDKPSIAELSDFIVLPYFIGVFSG